MNYNQFSNISCYEEFEIQCALAGISKVDVLKEIGHQVNDYYFFVSNDGIFNWFDLDGNHIGDPGVLETLVHDYIPYNIITKCIIPNSVTYIGIDAFWNCYSLEEITIPNSVISIGNGAFLSCKSLISITLPNSITSIADSAFSYCRSLTSITIPNSVINIGYGAFAYCESLKEITIPDSVTSIGDFTFLYCKLLKEVVFKGKTLEEVKLMKNYPFGIKDENVFKFS